MCKDFIKEKATERKTERTQRPVRPQCKSDPSEGERERLCRSILNYVKSKESVARPSGSPQDKVDGQESNVS